jgi:predicted PurR-regulated permease PerM
MPVRDFMQRTGLVILLAGLALFAWSIRDVVLLAFGAILMALMLDALTGLVCRSTGLSRNPSLVIITATIFILLGGFGWLFGSQVAIEFEDLAHALPRLLQRIQEWLNGRDWGRALLAHLKQSDVADGNGAAAAILATLSSVIGAVGNLLIVVFGGLYLAAQPHLYVDGVMRLVPVGQRGRIGQAGDAVAHSLRRWLLGQLVSMLIVTALTVGLLLLRVPAALALGLIAGMAEFVPIVGPILAVVPALMIALPESIALAAYVALLYLVIQQAESYIITPLVQQAVVSLPPMIVLFAILAFGTALGPLGLLFATPLAAAIMVAVETLYPDKPSRKSR